MRLTALLSIVLVCASVGVTAQVVTPSTEQMVQQLTAKPRLRSLRNLSVETAINTEAVSDAPLERPSLSLLIQFDFNSAKVRPQSQQALSNLSQALLASELAGSRFAVEGHTDAKGNADYNLKLSAQRAQAVADYLKAQGVKEERLLAAGKGATELANSESPYAAENRRVRIVNLD